MFKSCPRNHKSQMRKHLGFPFSLFTLHFSLISPGFQGFFGGLGLWRFPLSLASKRRQRGLTQTLTHTGVWSG